jgi:hypothetical protein
LPALAHLAGSSSTELASFLEPFARQLLGPQNRWASTTWGILETVALPAAAVTEAWQLLLAAAVQLEGATFMPGEQLFIKQSGSCVCCNKYVRAVLWV